MNLEQLKSEWKDTPESHTHIHESFIVNVNADELLNQHRTWVENNVFGMGERSFQWFWKILVDELPDNFKLLEIGVHKAQILSLVRLLANRIGKSVTIYGITPMNGAGTGWTEDDYEGDIAKIHSVFNIEEPILYKGLSTEPDALHFAMGNGEYDVLYVDGSHTYDDCMSDLITYVQFIKLDGYLVIDDACCDLNFPPSGFFTGIDTVTNATLDYLKKYGYEWEFQFNVVHLRVYKRK